MNIKTVKPKFFWHKNRKTDLENSQNRKTENPNAPLLYVTPTRALIQVKKLQTWRMTPFQEWQRNLWKIVGLAFLNLNSSAFVMSPKCSLFLEFQRIWDLYLQQGSSFEGEQLITIKMRDQWEMLICRYTTSDSLISLFMKNLCYYNPFLPRKRASLPLNTTC